MTYSDCWIRKIGEPVPEERGARFNYGRLGLPPGGNVYWLPDVQRWAEANAIAIDWKDNCWFVIEASAEEVAGFLDHFYGAGQGTDMVGQLEAGARYQIQVEEF